MALALEGKVAVITGGNSGVGYGIAEEFVAQGATVVIFGRNQETLDQSVEGLGAKSSAMRADAASPKEMETALKAVKAKYDRLDILVANAGVGEHARLARSPRSSSTRCAAQEANSVRELRAAHAEYW